MLTFSIDNKINSRRGKFYIFNAVISWNLENLHCCCKRLVFVVKQNLVKPVTYSQNTTVVMLVAETQFIESG